MKQSYPIYIFSMIFLFNSISLHATWRDYIPFTAKKGETEIIQQEFMVKANPIITVKDTVGCIEVKTWKQNKISLTATKMAPKAEMLSAIEMKVDTTADGITITTNSQKDSAVSMNYMLLIPAQSHVNLVTQTGDIKVAGVTGRICTTTDKGNIEIGQAHNTIIANANSFGSITIDQAKGNTKATCGRGNITINDAQSSVIAFTQSGNIDVKNSCVPATSKINLETKSGLIAVKLPSQVNANLKASAHKGVVTSQHLITLKQRTTKLDNASWKQLKAQVDGILGTGEANIVLTTNKGNIKILESRTKTA